MIQQIWEWISSEEGYIKLGERARKRHFQPSEAAPLPWCVCGLKFIPQTQTQTLSYSFPPTPSPSNSLSLTLSPITPTQILEKEGNVTRAGIDLLQELGDTCAPSKDYFFIRSQITSGQSHIISKSLLIALLTDSETRPSILIGEKW